MHCEDEFDLQESLESLFPGLSLGGGLLDQWTTGLRFNIGLSEVDRAVSIFDTIFRDVEALILLREDSS